MSRIVGRIGAALGGLLLATAAHAVPVETTNGLNLRAGPGVDYPVVASMPGGAVLDMQGCRGSWCYVNYRGQLGWASGRYLARLPVRPRAGIPLLDWLTQPRRAYQAPPPPAPQALPRPVEQAAPAPAPTQRAAPSSAPAPGGSPAQEQASPRPDGSLLRGSSVNIDLNRPDTPAGATDEATEGEGAPISAAERLRRSGS